MKKMYFLTVVIIAVITAGFLLYSSDADALSREFLSSYGIKISGVVATEKFIIPKEFDSHYDSYNMMQIESGLDLTPYKGKQAVRRTYIVTNFPEDTQNTVLANVIFVNRRPVAGDINSPNLSGFILPLSYMLTRVTQ